MFQHFRMNKNTFMFICDKLRPELTAKPSNFKSALTVELKVAISLYKLASCAEYRIVGNQFAVHKTTVQQTLYQFCRAVLKVFLREEIQLPGDNEIIKLMEEFETKSNIPNIWGSIDDSHIPITPTADGRRDFINRKGWPSLGLRWASSCSRQQLFVSYIFRDITCKHPGSTHDATVFKDSGFYEKMQNKKMPVKLVDEREVAACIVGDPVYPLLPWLIKGYTGSVTAEQESLNIYLNRARIVVENTFGRLKGRWRIFYIDVRFVPNVVAVCCILHNILERQKVPYLAAWDNPVEDAILTQPENSTMRYSNTLPGDEIRETLKNYMVQHFDLLKSQLREN